MSTPEGDRGQGVMDNGYKYRHQTNRTHIFQKRVQKFCFCWRNVPWYLGLKITAWMTVSFGIVQCIIFTGLLFPGSPSGINIFILFPIFCSTIISQLIIFVGLGCLLWIGVIIGKFNFIQTFPWGMLAGYLLAFIFLLLILIQGESIVKSLVWADHGITIKSDTDKEKKFLLKQQIIFYTVITIQIVSIVLFTTYIIILSLSWIDKLESEIKNSPV